MNTKFHLAVTALVLLCTAAVYTQNKSVYTSTKTSACKTIESTWEGTGSYVGECAGTGGFKVQLVEGDIRQTLNVITPNRKKFELKFWNFYSSFSSIGEKLEWRIKKGVPIAIIARYNVADPEGSTKGVSYLMIAKIGRAASCVTDVVLPGPSQSENARTLADAAQGKPCKSTE